MTDPFDTADFFDAREADRYTFESPDEAVVDALDYCAHRGCDILGAIRDRGPITVAAHARKQIDTGVIARLVDTLYDATFDHLLEMEELCDPEESSEHILSPEGRDDFRAGLQALIARVLREHATVWACKKVGERTYSPGEVEAICRAECPEWFEETYP